LVYSRYFLPRIIDWACSRPGGEEERQRLIPQVSGTVLEVGIGSGMNLPFYDSSRVSSLHAVDPLEKLWERRRTSLEDLNFKVYYSTAGAEALPFDDAFFDTVVSTNTLCSIREIETALAEISRVLKPGGSLVFKEHGLAPDEKVARFQKRLNPLWKRISGGCHLDRDISGLLEAAGFRLDDMEEGYKDGWRALSYNYWGLATKKL